MRKALVLIAAPLCVGMAFLTAWIFELSTEHVLVLAPVIVVVTGGIVGLLLLWTKMFWESVVRRSK